MSFANSSKSGAKLTIANESSSSSASSSTSSFHGKAGQSLDEPATNLTNLANLDRANFFSQQQQMRAEAAAGLAFSSASSSTGQSQFGSTTRRLSDSQASDSKSNPQSSSVIEVSSELQNYFNQISIGDNENTSSGSNNSNNSILVTGKKSTFDTKNNLPLQHRHFGHFFSRKTFHKPTYCQHCGDLLWGLIGQGLLCDVCNFIVHEKCLRQEGVSACSTVATQLVKNPTPHCWISDIHPKRKFCNVCRKRIEDNTKIFKCTICEYYVHVECIEFSLSNCKECATYVPNQKLSNINLYHHWREGNLLQSSTSKCCWCRTRCCNSDCLTGLRCEWCQATAHANCIRNLNRECNLGVLHNIILPPYCVSVPRTDVRIETIIGIRQSVKLLSLIGNINSSQSNQMPSNLLDPSNVITINANALHFALLSTNSSTTSGTPVSTTMSATLSSTSTNTHQSNAASNLTKQQQQQQFHYHSKSGQNLPRSATNTSNDFDFISESDSTAFEPMQYQPQCRENEQVYIRIFDGNSTIKRLNFRWISIFRKATRDQLVSACLRTYHVYDEDLSQYAIIDISEFISKVLSQVMVSPLPSNHGNVLHQQYNPLSSLNISSINERELDVSESQYPILSIVKNIPEKKEYASILIRFRPCTEQIGFIKVFPGKLNVEGPVCDDSFVTIKVQSETTVDEVISDAINRFNCQIKDSSRYKLVELSLDKASSIHERTMDNQECPWEIIKNIARDSIRQKKNLRFYLHQKNDLSCSIVQIFIGNLPLNLKQTQYEQIIIDRLPKPYRFKSMNPIYYEHGGCVLTYDQADIAVKAFNMLDEAIFKVGDEERKLVAVLLPTINPELISPGVKPLLVFVNVRSGGRQGLEFLTSIRRLLNPFQVYDLENGGPLPGLYAFRKLNEYKILVLGGDGSVGWVLQCLDNVGQDSVCQSPPCAIIPLGTGNDLARVLRWGTGYTGNEDPISFLREVMDAEEVILDRWTVVFHSDESHSNQTYSSSGSSSISSQDNSNIFVMNNYFGIGIDAELCLEFHNSREENPYKFNSRLYNKGVYVKQALRKIVHRKRNEGSSFNREISLEVDGIPISLPTVEGLIVLNIASWGSGANPWGPEQDDRYSTPTHYDGLLEIVGVSGIVHMGQIQSGISRAHRIAQGSRIKIKLKSEFAVQVDGEPWVQPIGEINILRSALKATMLRRNKMRRRNTEPSINQEITLDKSIQKDESSNEG